MLFIALVSPGSISKVKLDHFGAERVGLDRVVGLRFERHDVRDRERSAWFEAGEAGPAQCGAAGAHAEKQRAGKRHYRDALW